MVHRPSGFPDLVHEFKKELFSLLLMIIRSQYKHWPIPQQASNRRLLRTVVEFVNVHRDSPLSLTDLCNVGQVSENTLINTFKRGLGMTPMAYVKALRLYNVYRELWRKKTSDIRVSDVANAWGFWHMGQFAADYCKLFGELPSETLRRLN
jgi:AraC family ethanolamine operon transcriptional activator